MQFARRVRFHAIALSLLLVGITAGGSTAVQGQVQTASAATRSDEAVYRDACAACHGRDGRGAAPELVGLDIPLPDFTDCSFATREPDADWYAVTHDGGPARAFDRRMPAFGEALSVEEMEAALAHIRTFCSSRAWPRGELNLPRPLFTEKAYPEDEAVATVTIGTGDARSVTTQLLYEKRIGARSQYEVVVPIAFAETTDSWERGLGDVAFAFKHALFHSLETGSIFSLAGEVILPTGKETRGLGGGVTKFEPFLAAGQILPGASFVQAQAGAELSTDRSRAGHEAFWRFAIGRTWEQPNFGRAWTPMVEVLGARELESGARVHWDLAPQLQVTLSQRQHIILNGGVRVPLNERDGRHAQVVTYLLWDWFDGGLWDGW
jgi:mono/diheme cytochrome c family protein